MPALVPRYRLDQLIMEYNMTLSTDHTPIDMIPLEMFVSLLYVLLFLIGITSNIWVLIVILTVSRSSWSGYTNVLFYIASLCCINLLVLFTVPASLADLITGNWSLPDWVCSLYWTIELLNKILSSMIIAFIAMACCAAVCRPHAVFIYKKNISAIVHLACAVSVVLWQGCAVWKHSQVFYMMETTENHSYILNKKCLYEPENTEDKQRFAIISMISGYAIPIIIVFSCYTAILYKVYDQACIIGGRRLTQFFNVVKSSSILVIFYLCTWTPYWCVTLLLSGWMEYDARIQENVGKLAFIFHTLPIANCAFSPLIYTILNRNLREQYKRAREERRALKNDSRSRVTYV